MGAQAAIGGGRWAVKVKDASDGSFAAYRWFGHARRDDPRRRRDVGDGQVLGRRCASWVSRRTPACSGLRRNAAALWWQHLHGTPVPQAAVRAARDFDARDALEERGDVLSSLGIGRWAASGGTSFVTP